MAREKIFDKLVPAQFRLEPTQHEALRRAAKKAKISASEYLRQLIDTHVIKISKEGDTA